MKKPKPPKASSLPSSATSKPTICSAPSFPKLFLQICRLQHGKPVLQRLHVLLSDPSRLSSPSGLAALSQACTQMSSLSTTPSAKKQWKTLALAVGKLCDAATGGPTNSNSCSTSKPNPPTGYH